MGVARKCGRFENALARPDSQESSDLVKLDGMKAEEIPPWARGDEFDPASIELVVNSWSDFETAYERYFRRKRGRWYFRGQPDSTLPLQTTLERLLQQVGRPMNVRPYPVYPSGHSAATPGGRVELVLLRAFQARASKFLPNLPLRSEILEWLALMRHWGLPTRLLDVTTSPHVALFFALVGLLRSDSSNHRTDQQKAPNPIVWAINHIPVRAIGAKEATGVLAHLDLSETGLFNEHFLSDPPKAFVAPVHPRSHNDRLAAQQGTFLCVGNVDLSFGDNMLNCAPVEDIAGQGFFRKLVINREAGIEILSRLSAMNIHSGALFPDLSGYARSIEESLLLYGKDTQQERHLDFESLERLGWLG